MSTLVLLDTSDKRAVRNKDAALLIYDLLTRDPESLRSRVSPNYRQHNPFLGDGPEGLVKAFSGVVKAHPKFHIVVHRIIASGDYVWAHVNFVNMLSDDPNDLGVAGVDIFRMDANGSAVEHWDVLQTVDPKNSAPYIAPGLPSNNSNSMLGD